MRVGGSGQVVARGVVPGSRPSTTTRSPSPVPRIPVPRRPRSDRGSVPGADSSGTLVSHCRGGAVDAVRSEPYREPRPGSWRHATGASSTRTADGRSRRPARVPLCPSSGTSTPGPCPPFERVRRLRDTTRRGITAPDRSRDGAPVSTERRPIVRWTGTRIRWRETARREGPTCIRKKLINRQWGHSRVVDTERRTAQGLRDPPMDWRAPGHPIGGQNPGERPPEGPSARSDRVGERDVTVDGRLGGLSTETSQLPHTYTPTAVSFAVYDLVMRTERVGNRGSASGPFGGPSRVAVDVRGRSLRGTGHPSFRAETGTTGASPTTAT